MTNERTFWLSVILLTCCSGCGYRTAHHSNPNSNTKEVLHTAAINSGVEFNNSACRYDLDVLSRQVKQGKIQENKNLIDCIYNSLSFKGHERRIAENKKREEYVKQELGININLLTFGTTYSEMFQVPDKNVKNDIIAALKGDRKITKNIITFYRTVHEHELEKAWIAFAGWLE